MSNRQFVFPPKTIPGPQVSDGHGHGNEEDPAVESLLLLSQASEHMETRRAAQVPYHPQHPPHTPDPWYYGERHKPQPPHYHQPYPSPHHHPSSPAYFTHPAHHRTQNVATHKTAEGIVVDHHESQPPPHRHYPSPPAYSTQPRALNSATNIPLPHEATEVVAPTTSSTAAASKPSRKRKATDEPPATPTPPTKTRKKRGRGAGKENTAAHAPEHGQAATKDSAADAACIDAMGGGADVVAGHVNDDFIDMTGGDEGVGGLGADLPKKPDGAPAKKTSKMKGEDYTDNIVESCRWSVAEKTTLFKFILDPESDKNFKMHKKNPDYVYKKAMSLFRNKYTQAAIKGQYTRSLKMFNWIVAFEGFTGNGGGDGDADSDDDMLAQHSRRLTKARAAGLALGHLNAKTVEEWNQQGWYTAVISPLVSRIKVPNVLWLVTKINADIVEYHQRLNGFVRFSHIIMSSKFLERWKATFE